MIVLALIVLVGVLIVFVGAGIGGYRLGHRFGMYAFGIVILTTIIMTVVAVNVLWFGSAVVTIPAGLLALVTTAVGNLRHRRNSTVDEVVAILDEAGVDPSVFLRWVDYDDSHRHLSKEDLIAHFEPIGHDQADDGR